MIDPAARLALSTRSHAIRRDLEDFAQRQTQRERTLEALAHHQQKMTARLQRLVRDVHRLSDATARLDASATAAADRADAAPPSDAFRTIASRGASGVPSRAPARTPYPLPHSPARAVPDTPGHPAVSTTGPGAPSP